MALGRKLERKEHRQLPLTKQEFPKQHSKFQVSQVACGLTDIQTGPSGALNSSYSHNRYMAGTRG